MTSFWFTLIVGPGIVSVVLVDPQPFVWDPYKEMLTLLPRVRTSVIAVTPRSRPTVRNARTTLFTTQPATTRIVTPLMKLFPTAKVGRSRGKRSPIAGRDRAPGRGRASAPRTGTGSWAPPLRCTHASEPGPPRGTRLH